MVRCRRCQEWETLFRHAHCRPLARHLILHLFAVLHPTSFVDHRSRRYSASKIPREFFSDPPPAVSWAVAQVSAEAADELAPWVREGLARKEARRGRGRCRKELQRKLQV
jgi:hypothetical protein